MTEIERRLRAAMHAAVDGEQPAPGLLESVMARRWRHRTRTALACVAVVAAGALALPPAVRALHGRTSPGNQTSAHARPPRAAPGTVLNDCGDSIGMQLPLDWRTGSVAAGPLWFLGLRQATAAYDGNSKLAIGGLVVNVRDGATAWVRVVGPAAGHFRFLFGRGDFIYGPGGRRYTLAGGENGVTFAGCSPASPGSDNIGEAPGYTEFDGRYLVDKIPVRVSLDVWTPASRRPTRITFLVGY